MVTTITDSERKINKKKAGKKSFWFEFAEEQGVNPHKSAWTEFHHKEKEEKR